MSGSYKNQWRAYETAAGAKPVLEFLNALTDEEGADVAAEMRVVREQGLEAAKHLRGDIYEVRVSSTTRDFRILFAAEGHYSHILLSLSAFVKKTQKTPKHELELAETRLHEWRTRGAAKKKQGAASSKKK